MKYYALIIFVILLVFLSCFQTSQILVEKLTVQLKEKEKEKEKKKEKEKEKEKRNHIETTSKKENIGSINFVNKDGENIHSIPVNWEDNFMKDLKKEIKHTKEIIEDEKNDISDNSINKNNKNKNNKNNDNKNNNDNDNVSNNDNVNNDNVNNDNVNNDNVNNDNVNNDNVNNGNDDVNNMNSYARFFDKLNDSPVMTYNTNGQPNYGFI